MEENNRLVELCIESACRSTDSVEKWRRQLRSIERLPSQLADALFRRLHSRRLLHPYLIEVFKYGVEEINLSGDNAVDAEWMAYIGSCRYLRILYVADCHRLTSSALWPIGGMTNLKELDLSRCLKFTDAGIRHLLSISTLEKLWISETGVTADGVALLASLENLMVLDLGGLPVTDHAISSLQVLTKLHYLDIWGSKISDDGSSVLQMFPKLSFLNLAWTDVTKFPDLPHLECLNMSNCNINSALKEYGVKSPLNKLILSGTTLSNEAEALEYIEISLLHYLDASNSSFQSFSFLPQMRALEYLNLSSTALGDDSIELIACVGENLRYLNLSNTAVASLGLGILAGKVPNLETIELSHTQIDDVAISYIAMMPSLNTVNLSNTKIKGFIRQPTANSDPFLSLSALQSLGCLKTLNLEQTQIEDSALRPLSRFQELSHLLLKSPKLTDISLQYLSSLPKLETLGVCDAVLTNSALDLFKPPKSIRKVDLRGCWLLTDDAISAFSKSFPQIELKHELVHELPYNKLGSYRKSPIQTAKRSQVTPEKGKMPMSSSFVDQRFKYSREELLALKYSSLPLSSSRDKADSIPKMNLTYN